MYINIEIPEVNKEMDRKGFCFVGSKNYNQLPNCLKAIKAENKIVKVGK